MTEPLLLDPAVDPDPELGDHPFDLTTEEAEAGRLLWQSIDDLDDDDNGIVRTTPLLTASPGYTEAKRRALIVKSCLLDAGVPEVSIEPMEGRPGAGDTWNLCRPVSVFSHHIASKPTPSNPIPGLLLVKQGRSDLGGPLANGAAGVDLVYRILCLGMANHPGEGGPLTVSGPLGAYTIPRDSARAYAWGTEYEGGYSDAVWDKVYTNARTGKSMTFREFMGRSNAGLARAIWLINGHGKNPGEAGELDLSGYTGEHKTWAPGRKPDRLNYSTESGRAEVRKYNDGGDDVSAKDVWEYGIKPVGKGLADAAKIPARVMLAQAHNRAAVAREHAWAAAKNSENALRIAKANREAIRAIADTLDDDAASTVRVALGPDGIIQIATPEDAPDFDEDSDDQ